MNEIVQTMSGPLICPIVLCLALGAAAYVLSRILPAVCKVLALAAGVVTLGAGILLWRNHWGETFSRLWADLGGGIMLSVDLAATPLGLLVVAAAGAFAVLITIYSFRALAGDYWEGRFYAYLCWTLAGAMAVALAGNLLVLLIGWELVTLMLYLMINHGRGEAQAAGAKTYAILGFADACLMLGLALLASGKGGTANWSLTRGPVPVGTLGGTGYVAYIAILIAALAKAGAIPVHTWIPSAAKDTPTPVMAFLPASLDKLLGIYLLAVLALRMFKPDWPLQVVMMVIGAVTIVAAVLMAMLQHNLKRLLAFHAVSQVGYMVLGLASGTVVGIIGGLMHMINNAIYKSNLFLMSGTVSRATGTDDVEDMGGLAKCLPITFACSLVAAASISGVPPFNGFVSKWLIYQGALGVSSSSPGLAMALVVAAVFGSALTLASFVKVMYSAFLSPAPKNAAWRDDPPRENFWLAAPMVVLALACIVLGLLPGSIINAGIVQTAREATAAGPRVAVSLAEVESASGRWGPTEATTLILLGILGGLVLLWLMRARKVRIVRPFLGGEVPAPDDDRFRVPATHFYRTVAELPVTGPLLTHGDKGALDAYYWSAKHGNSFVQVLRRWHTGLISLYVTWCLLGLTVILVYLLLAARS